jgi:hypothetical protein
MACEVRWLGAALLLAAAAGCGEEETTTELPPEARDAMAQAGDLDATFPLLADAGSIASLRSALPTTFAGFGALAVSTPAVTAALLDAFSGAPANDADLKLAIFALALEGHVDGAGATRLRAFLKENLTGDLGLAPHFLTHTVARQDGSAGSGETGWYTGFRIHAASEGKGVAGLPLTGEVALAVEAPKTCKKRWLVLGPDDKPILFVDPKDGAGAMPKPLAIEGDQHADATVPAVTDAHWREQVASGGGAYVNDDPEFVGKPSKQFNCGGYAFRELNGGKRWTADPAEIQRTFVAAGVLEEVPEAQAKPTDKVFFYDAHSSKIVQHVGEVKSVAGGIVVRNADHQSGLFDASIDAKYFKGSFLGLVDKARYGARKFYRYKGGKAPKVIVDPASLTNAAYCGATTGGDGTLTVNVDVPNFVLSFVPNFKFVAREQDCNVAVTMVPCKLVVLTASETPLGASEPDEVLTVAFSSGFVGGPGTYGVGTAGAWNKHDGSAPVLIDFLSKQVKDADGDPHILFSESGSVELTTWSPGVGGRIIGTFSATIQDEFFHTMKDANGDPIWEKLTGTIDGSFDLPVQ